MNTRYLSAALMAAGLLIAAAAFAQNSSVQKQKTQEGTDSAFSQESNQKYKQKTQDSAFWQENNEQTKPRTPR
jgi:hypothetical protein